MFLSTTLFGDEKRSGEVIRPFSPPSQSQFDCSLSPEISFLSWEENDDPTFYDRIGREGERARVLLLRRKEG